MSIAKTEYISTFILEDMLTLLRIDCVDIAAAERYLQAAEKGPSSSLFICFTIYSFLYVLCFLCWLVTDFFFVLIVIMKKNITFTVLFIVSL